MKKKFDKTVVVGALAACTALAAVGAVLAPGAGYALDTQATLAESETATVVTDEHGEAYARVIIANDGRYSLKSVSSEGVKGDTIGILYADESLTTEVAASDDVHADTNFCISETLKAGTYYLNVYGKEKQAGASITVALQEGAALNSLECKAGYSSSKGAYTFELGTWANGKDKTTWEAADAGSYAVEGFADASVFAHAQESGTLMQLNWNDGLPTGPGRFVVKVSPTAGGAYAGDAYYRLEGDVDTASIAELDPHITMAVCGAVGKVELGKTTTIPTNWDSRWDAVTASYYAVTGYCARDVFEGNGSDDSAVTWEAGLPHDAGSFVILLEATEADGNPYSGSCHVWVEVGELNHAGAGDWVVDKRPTFSAAGSRHLNCTYCGSPCDETSIPALKNTATTAGSGATLADYRFLTSKTVRFQKSYAPKKTVKVPNTVKIDGVSYKVTEVAAKAFKGMGALTSASIGSNVTKIGANAFKGCKKLKTLKVSGKKLQKAGVKKCLTGSSVKTVKVPSAKKKAYQKIFTKAVCGKKVTVK